MKGFFRGLVPAIVRGGGASSVYFHTLSKLDELTFEKWKFSPDSSFCHFLNSAISRSVSTIVLNPFNIVGSRIEIPGYN